MPDLTFLGFVYLLVISVVVSFILHYLLMYYVNPGFWSFLSKVIVGYIGAGLGTSFFGEWFDQLEHEGIYFIPAILGAIAILILAVDVVKMRSGTPPRR